MCFSANASFGAGIVLTVIGIASIKKTQHPSQVLFAAIPFIFAVQQISEGCLWLMLRNPALLREQQLITYIFLCFAQIIWPAWVPISFLILEKRETRTKFQKILVGVGVLVSCYLGYCLINFPVQARIVSHHITYDQAYPPSLSILVALLYLVATITPPFFSHIRKMRWLGAAILMSYIITTIFYDDYLISVWCFFASVISIAVYAIIYEIVKVKPSLVPLPTSMGL
jgi:hypothetical protein